ncbi:MAG: glycosyltransferase family 39 protein [Deltaproteobacteria bacterium]|nr:glycosyltransferase family 39 protein [Deltaproteobacteria bacterium]
MNNPPSISLYPASRPRRPEGRRFFIIVLVFIACARLFSLGAYSLTDTTEARYAEIGRKMYETNNWITPQIDYGVPFWGKPPLSTWLVAGSFRLFGVGEFTARLPSFVLSILICLLVYLSVPSGLENGDKSHDGRHAGQTAVHDGLLSVTILASTGLFFITSGAVLTDQAMLLGTTLSMVGFWQAVEDGWWAIADGPEGAQEPPVRVRLWGYLFFIGLALGLLAKGPVATVLTVFPIGAWVLWKKKAGLVWRRLPWISGIALTLALAAPWYLLAESRTPGFLEYFFIGEHWKRFTQSGWKGDLYGNPHPWGRGAIWAQWFFAVLPWSFVLILTDVWPALRRPGALSGGLGAVLSDGRKSYLLLWAVTPMLFFTFAANILPTYVITGLPAFALLAAEAWPPEEAEGKPGRPTSRPRRPMTWTWRAAALFTPLAFIVVLVIYTAGMQELKSQKVIVEKYLQLRKGALSRLIYVSKRPYSAEFYSRGAAMKAETAGEAMELAARHSVQGGHGGQPAGHAGGAGEVFLVIRTGESEARLKTLEPKPERVMEYHGYTLFRGR